MNIPEDDRNQIFRLFAIRLRLWKGEPLPDADQRFWDTTYSQVPSLDYSLNSLANKERML